MCNYSLYLTVSISVILCDESVSELFHACSVPDLKLLFFVVRHKEKRFGLHWSCDQAMQVMGP